MRKLALKTYLIGQCSKLAQPQELEAYVKGAHQRKPLETEVWDLLQHSPQIEDTAAFARAEYAEALFESLPEASLTRIAEIFSLHHNNSVHKRIRENPDWELRTFAVEQIEVGYIERELKACIQRHHHQLTAVAADSETVWHKHYKDRDLQTSVPYEVFLATWARSGQPRLIDGNHRAIHQARRLAAGNACGDEFKIVMPLRTSPKIADCVRAAAKVAAAPAR